MGLSTNTYVYSGGAQTFPVNFALGFLNRSDVTVYVEGEFDGQDNQVYRAFTWNSDNEIVVTDAIDVSGGSKNVTVQRTVDKDELVVNFNAEGSATRRNIQFGLTQAMMAMHEFIDGRIEPLEDVYPFSAYLEQMLDVLAEVEDLNDNVVTRSDQVTAQYNSLVSLIGITTGFDPRQTYIDARDAV